MVGAVIRGFESGRRGTVLPERGIDVNGLLDDFAQVMDFLERAAVKDQKSFQGLFGGLLAVVNACVEMSIRQEPFCSLKQRKIANPN